MAGDTAYSGVLVLRQMLRVGLLGLVFLPFESALAGEALSFGLGVFDRSAGIPFSRL